MYVIKIDDNLARDLEDLAALRGQSVRACVTVIIRQECTAIIHDADKKELNELIAEYGKEFGTRLMNLRKQARQGVPLFDESDRPPRASGRADFRVYYRGRRRAMFIT